LACFFLLVVDRSSESYLVTLIRDRELFLLLLQDVLACDYLIAKKGRT